MRETPKILIVDDEPDILNLIQAGMRQKGYQTVTATTGEDALKIATQIEPDLVLLDVVLPDQNGMEVCRQIKSHLSSFVPIILVTVKQDLDSKVSGTDHGADDFLTKPFIMEELHTKVRAMLRIKKLYGQLEHCAITDNLTGLYNRHYLMTRLKEECDRSLRSQKPFSAIMMDLDFFKRINDTYGHPCGDFVLRHFTAVVKQVIRKTDLLARYGGEEFLLMLPETPVFEAAKMAEIIRRRVEQRPIYSQNLAVPITCSIGVCGFPAPAINHYEKMIQCLDDALYRAKRQGRNRVYVHRALDIVGHEENSGSASLFASGL